MPAQYEHIRDSYIKSGKPEKRAKELAARTYIAKGKAGSRSSRAKALQSDKYDAPKGAMKHLVSNYAKKGKK